MTCITDWTYSKYIVGSSLFFQIPAFYAYRHEMYAYSAMSFITSVLSIHHWRYPQRGSWRNKIDVVWARGALVWFFIEGVKYSSFLTSMSTTMMMGWVFYLATIKYQEDPYGNWYLFHMMFHLIAAGGQLGITHYRRLN